ncbi:MAG: DUF2817 domain-containing protein [Bradymonadia bacterium]
MTDLPAFFSDDYVTARRRFVEAARAAGLTQASHPLGGIGPDGTPLTLDVAILPPPDGKPPKLTVVVSSGLHGIEGYFGSAVQLALLHQPLAPIPGVRQVLIHALNPYGFAWIRRVNEHNIDLNRNFLHPGEAYTGSPEAYGALDRLLNPPSPPKAFEFFMLRAGAQIARRGYSALKEAVASGQYDFPLGLFFGGDGPSDLVGLLDAELPGWIGGAPEVLHVDFHTGLGSSGTYALIVDRAADHPRARWMADLFGEQVIQPWDTGGVSYAIRGGMGTWCQQRVPEANYDVITAEFGTVPSLKVLKALRAENRAHHHCSAEDRRRKAAKGQLREAFIPRDPSWRHVVVERGLAVVEQALSARDHISETT